MPDKLTLKVLNKMKFNPIAFNLSSYVRIPVNIRLRFLQMMEDNYLMHMSDCEAIFFIDGLAHFQSNSSNNISCDYFKLVQWNPDCEIFECSHFSLDEGLKKYPEFLSQLPETQTRLWIKYMQSLELRANSIIKTEVAKSALKSKLQEGSAIMFIEGDAVFIFKDFTHLIKISDHEIATISVQEFSGKLPLMPIFGQCIFEFLSSARKAYADANLAPVVTSPVSSPTFIRPVSEGPFYWNSGIESAPFSNDVGRTAPASYDLFTQNINFAGRIASVARRSPLITYDKEWIRFLAPYPHKSEYRKQEYSVYQIDLSSGRYAWDDNAIEGNTQLIFENKKMKRLLQDQILSLAIPEFDSQTRQATANLFAHNWAYLGRNAQGEVYLGNPSLKQIYAIKDGRSRKEDAHQYAQRVLGSPTLWVWQFS